MPMQRVSKGYTIIEVLIFLAISGVLLASAMLLISGKQNTTEFNQKMRDTKSKIDDWLNDVSTGFTGGSPDNQHCQVMGRQPQVQAGAPGPNYDPDCVFLGKALLLSTNPASNDNILAYSVFGCRLNPCNSAAGTLPQDYTQATPTPQTGASGGVPLTETFNLGPANIMKVTASWPYTTSQLVGFFSSFSTDVGQNGSSDVAISEFNYSGIGLSPEQCLMLIGSCGIASPTPPKPLTSYKICLSDGKRYADVVITSTGGVGAQTDLQYVNSLASC
jgi:type II secretory pathway pseudopilin PulG